MSDKQPTGIHYHSHSPTYPAYTNPETKDRTQTRLTKDLQKFRSQR